MGPEVIEPTASIWRNLVGAPLRQTVVYRLPDHTLGYGAWQTCLMT